MISGKSYAKLIVTSLLLIGVGTLLIMLGFHMATMPSSSSSSYHNQGDSIPLVKEKEEELVGLLKELIEKESIRDSPIVGECEVVIIGTGVGGLVSAYRLAHLGRRLCIFERENEIGGEIRSVREIYGTGSTNERPVWVTPTGRDYLREGDVLMRCMAHEMGSIMITDGSFSSPEVKARHDRIFHNGPFVGLFQKVLDLLVKKHVRIYTSSPVSFIKPFSNREYFITVNNTKEFKTKHLILTVSPKEVNNIFQEDVFVDIKEKKECVWSAFFQEKWWTSLSSGSIDKEWYRWNHSSDPQQSGISSILYRPTPEGRESNMIRYKWKEEACQEVSLIYKETGLIGLKNQVMSRTKTLLGKSDIKDPVQSYFSFRRYYEGTLKGKEEEGYCIVKEGEWMEDSAKSVNECLKRRVFQEMNIAFGEECSHYGKTLTKEKGEKDTCLLLKNEYHLRDLMNLSYCGGQNIFPYPSLSSLYEPLPWDTKRVPFPVPIYDD